MEKFTKETAETIKSWFESEEVKAAIEATEKEVDADTGTFEVVITTENLDRYQEVISMEGWELEHYRSNPVVLWGHDHNRIIGVATSISIEDGKMVARGKFAPTEEGQEKRKLYEQGFLKATSVGFIEKEREGNLITKAELLEFSFVSVPANPYALSLAMEKELSINELVTKGIFTLKEVETTEEPEGEPAEPEEEPETPAEPETPEEPAEPTEKTFTNKSLQPVAEHLRAALVALEALETEEPERNDDEPEVEETEDEKQLREFHDARKTLQDASTVISEVLAQARQAIQVRR